MDTLLVRQGRHESRAYKSPFLVPRQRFYSTQAALHTRTKRILTMPHVHEAFCKMDFSSDPGRVLRRHHSLTQLDERKVMANYADVQRFVFRRV